MYACMNGPPRHLFGVASLPATTTFDMGLGGAITKNDIGSMRSAGTYGWHGISNTLFVSSSHFLFRLYLRRFTNMIVVG
jgi:hypothetical protein